MQPAVGVKCNCIATRGWVKTLVLPEHDDSDMQILAAKVKFGVLMPSGRFEVTHRLE